MAVLEEEVLSPFKNAVEVINAQYDLRTSERQLTPLPSKPLYTHITYTKTSVPLITFHTCIISAFPPDNFIYTVIRYFADPEFSLRKSEITLKLHIS